MCQNYENEEYITTFKRLSMEKEAMFLQNGVDVESNSGGSLARANQKNLDACFRIYY